MEDVRLTAALRAQGIHDERVLKSMEALNRQEFVDLDQRECAWRDEPLPIGEGQTISQPYVVARMTQALGLIPGERVLEIGTGSGYQTAVLLGLGVDVYTVEVRSALAERARLRLGRRFEERLHMRVGDGRSGWPEAAPFDAILLTAAPEEVPQALLSQLSLGGRLVAPIGPPNGTQQLVRIVRHPDGSLRTETLFAVRFVPMNAGPSSSG